MAPAAPERSASDSRSNESPISVTFHSDIGILHRSSLLRLPVPDKPIEAGSSGDPLIAYQSVAPGVRVDAELRAWCRAWCQGGIFPARTGRSVCAGLATPSLFTGAPSPTSCSSPAQRVLTCAGKRWGPLLGTRKVPCPPQARNYGTGTSGRRLMAQD